MTDLEPTPGDEFYDSTGMDLMTRGRWWQEALEDLARYRAHHGGSWVRPVLLEVGWWALLQYRIASGLHRSELPALVRLPLLAACVLGHKVTELVTGMSLPHRADIGPGTYLGHFGPVVIHADAVIGVGCNISQGTTVGVSGRGRRRGVPVLGDRVYLGAGAVVAGRVHVGDDAVIGANAVVTRDVPAGCTVSGSPAVVVDELGTRGMGLHQRPRP